MKLVTWNAAMRFRDKIEAIFPYMADIIVIPECEAPEKWRNSSNLQALTQFLWYGDNINKGIGIATLNDSYHIELHSAYNREFRYIIPLKVTGKDDFILLAIWSQNTKPQFNSYIGQIYLALKYYETLLKKPCVIIGDWNSNKIFDHIKRVGTHSEVVELLKNEGIKSAYHMYFNEEHGEETIPTHFFRKAQSSPFHIDFLFASELILSRLRHFEIGTYEKWIKFSDHVPLCAVFDE
ncbi:exonuclease III [Neobacillus niacini]|uniref:endonuclease/exonuclease/phosphatase family protein n=1 Tax=Neobacillus driksii TaxID=3035913 RepID=UPI002784EE56|nr:endonuclease/exonuclease/phosphatase family protein [Neobacillus niacini]MDQ0971245.1 exonuclease III [Neobacillus niacini]